MDLATDFLAHGTYPAGPATYGPLSPVYRIGLGVLLAGTLLVALTAEIRGRRKRLDHGR